MPVGVYIREVSEFSAAERAGLTKGDVITEFAGEKVTTADDLNAIKSRQTPGDTVSVKVDRNGRELTLSQESRSFWLCRKPRRFSRGRSSRLGMARARRAAPCRKRPPVLS